MRVYSSINTAADRRGTVVWVPKEDSENDIKFDLMRRLRADGFSCRSEVKVTDCVFDIVIYDRRQARAIIETKRKHIGEASAFEQTSQGWRYRLFGLPVILFWDLDRYADLVKYLRSGEFENTQPLKNPRNDTLVRLRSFLYRGSMAAFDAAQADSSNLKYSEMERKLEEYKEFVEAELSKK